MTTRTPLRTLSLFALASCVALAAGCSSDRRTGGGTVYKDSGVNTNQDSGQPPLDSGPNPFDSGTSSGCGSNPNGCVPHELIGAAPGCACLNICESGWTFSGGQCVPVSNPDGGTGTPDSGTPSGCTSNGDCTGTDPVCLAFNQTSGDLTFCAGEQNCACENRCAPNSPTTGCGAQQDCLWMALYTNTSVVDGVCVDALGGSTQGQACTATFDAGGNRTDDSCNTGQNYYCFGASPQNPAGVCSRLCPPSNQGVCTALGSYQCDNLGDPMGTIGLCLNPKPNYTDLGAACTGPGECMGNVCSMGLGNLCAADCSGLSTCPSDGICVSGMSLAPTCALECTTGGHSLCSARNANTACWPFNGFSLCLPKCTSDMDCSPSTCNMTTGICN